jgi:RNA-dependent RNA polymerase
VHDVDEAEFEIARSFDYPNPVHLNRFVVVFFLVNANMFSRPAVMALEDRGVDKKIFIDLQEEAKASIYLSSDSLEEFSRLLRKHGLGGKFHLAFILEQLSKLGLDFKDNNEKKKKAVGGAFVERLLRFSMNHSLREVKFKARIPVPKSYQLVGVADEGQAYIKEGVKEKDVFTLGPGRIYGAFLRGSRAVLPYANGNIQSVCKRMRMNHRITLRAHASYPEARSFTPATVRIYACLLRYR